MASSPGLLFSLHLMRPRASGCSSPSRAALNPRGVGKTGPSRMEQIAVLMLTGRSHPRVVTRVHKYRRSKHGLRWSYLPSVSHSSLGFERQSPLGAGPGIPDGWGTVRQVRGPLALSCISGFGARVSLQDRTSCSGVVLRTRPGLLTMGVAWGVGRDCSPRQENNANRVVVLPSCGSVQIAAEPSRSLVMRVRAQGGVGGHGTVKV